jgi:hypothetical protein
MSGLALRDALEAHQLWGDPNEPLHPDLVPYTRVSHELGTVVLHHPLVIEVFCDPIMYAMINKRYAHKREAIRVALDKCDWPGYVVMHERPYRVGALNRLLDLGHLTWADDNTAHLCQDVWVDSENIHDHLKFWRQAFRLTDGHQWMSPAERAEFDALPDVLRIYRGECNDGGVSWTRSKAVAKFFANRGVNESTGVVSSGYVDKRNVFAYLTRRGEQEVIVTNRNYVRTKR